MSPCVRCSNWAVQSSNCRAPLNPGARSLPARRRGGPEVVAGTLCLREATGRLHRRYRSAAHGKGSVAWRHPACPGLSDRIFGALNRGSNRRACSLFVRHAAEAPQIAHGSDGGLSHVATHKSKAMETVETTTTKRGAPTVDGRDAEGGTGAPAPYVGTRKVATAPAKACVPLMADGAPGSRPPGCLHVA